MTIGRLALSAGVHVETIRYYQRLGLMPLPARAYGTIRHYGPMDLKRLRFIKRAQKLGFSLEEIALLVGLAVGEHCAETKSLAEKKVFLVKDKLKALQTIQNVLDELIHACGTGKSGCGCPIIESLSDDESHGAARL